MEQPHPYQPILDLYEQILIEKSEQLSLKGFALSIEDYDFKSPRATSYLIQIPVQYIKMFELISKIILSNKNTFSWVGDPSKEQFDKSAFIANHSILSESDFRLANHLQDGINCDPLNKARQDFAQGLPHLIMSFFCFHELGHVRQYNLKEDYENTHIEFDNRDQNSFDSQVDEADADIFGINFFSVQVSNYIKFIEKNPGKSAFNSRRDFLLTTLYAIMLLFYATDSDNEIDDQHSEHPHSVVRMSYLSNLLLSVFVVNGFVASEKEFNDLLLDVLIEFDKAVQFVFGKDKGAYFQKFKLPQVVDMRLKIMARIPGIPYLNLNNKYHS